MNILVKENILLANQGPTTGDTIPKGQSFDSSGIGHVMKGCIIYFQACLEQEIYFHDFMID